VSSSVSSTRWEIVHYLACAMCIFGLLGLTGLYARQSRKPGWLNLVGYILLSLWFALIMGFSFIEAFALPHISRSSPGFVDGWMAMLNGSGSTAGMGALPTVWLLTAPIYMLGGLLFGIAIYRSGIFPRWAGVLLAAGTLLAPVAGLLPLAAQPKAAVPVGFAFIWLGYALWSNPASATATPAVVPRQTSNAMRTLDGEPAHPHGQPAARKIRS
jgi:hypothetical protein